jgi:hypothetical protein
MKQQLTIVKATLGAFNKTISDLEYNSQVTRDGLRKLKSYMERFATNTESRLNLLDIKITAEGHIAQVNHALTAMQRNLNLLIDSVINAQKGVLQPQIFTPSLLIETLQKSVPAFLKDTMAPFIIGKDADSLITRVCDVHIVTAPQQCIHLDL